MRRSRTQTRLRILDAAYGLFWRQGFLRVSVEDIAARAGITKRALYQHFRSKDDLIAAALAHCSELAIARLRDFRRPTKSDELIETFFTELADWAAKPRWSGGGFTRVVVELADLRGHPARAIARQHKATVEKWLADALAAARGCVAARSRTRNHAADGRLDAAHARPRRSQLCQGSRTSGQSTRSKALKRKCRVSPDALSRALPPDEGRAALCRIAYWALAEARREAPWFGPKTTTVAPVFTRL
jgi:AcrR family transcriptional regulator